MSFLQGNDEITSGSIVNCQQVRSRFVKTHQFIKADGTDGMDPDNAFPNKFLVAQMQYIRGVRFSARLMS
jgi:hypothetical protein